MTRSLSARFPPRRLAELSETAARRLRIVWFGALAASLLMVVCGTVFVLRDVYQRDPLFAALGFASAIESDGSATVSSSLLAADGALLAPEGSRIVALDQRVLATHTDLYTLGDALKANRNPAPLVTVLRPDGQRITQRIERSPRYRAAYESGQWLSLTARMTMRMLVSLTACLVLIAAAVLLALRRRRDPVCQLFSFAFLTFAACIDPALNMWLALGWGEAFDLVVTLGWAMLVLGIAVFPDGRFEPPWMRWILPGIPLLAVPLAIDEVPLMGSVLIAFVAPLALLWGLIRKCRRYDAGIERQQIKWGALGFGSGLVSISLAFVLMEMFPAEGTPYEFLTRMGVLVLFHCGFLLIAVGLLIALIRFRLWEADQVISRSAIFGGLAVVIGALWAASMDLLKMGVEYALGEDSKMLATALGAMLAAGLFGPASRC